MLLNMTAPATGYELMEAVSTWPRVLGIETPHMINATHAMMKIRCFMFNHDSPIFYTFLSNYSKRAISFPFVGL